VPILDKIDSRLTETNANSRQYKLVILEELEKLVKMSPTRCGYKTIDFWNEEDKIKYQLKQLGDGLALVRNWLDLESER